MSSNERTTTAAHDKERFSTKSNFRSDLPGDPRYLTFTPTEFVNECILAKDGPFTEENEQVSRVLSMYNRLRTLRINPVKFCVQQLPKSWEKWPLSCKLFSVLLAPAESHPFGLPFSAQEFLTICSEFEEYEFVHRGEQYTNKQPAEYAGSKQLFLRMVEDLVTFKINLRDFLAKQIPAEMEDSFTLLALLASAQGEYTQNFEVNYTRFIVSVFAPGGSRDGRLVGPLSHFQAAIVLQSFEQLDAELIGPDDKEKFRSPHALCEVGVAAEDLVVLYTPCCHSCYGKCCLTRTLMMNGPHCNSCMQDMAELVRSRSRDQ